MEKEVKITPLVISPLIYKEGNAVAQVERAWLHYLPGFFKPIILCSDLMEKSLVKEGIDVVTAHEHFCINEAFKFVRHSPFREFAYNPDIFRHSWQHNAEKAINKIMAYNKISYVHSTSMPYTSHLIACKVKKEYGIPWVASFYEPWVDNTYVPLSHQYFINKRKEQELIVATNADVILFNSEKAIDVWKERYGALIREKIHYLPMALDTSKLAISPKSIGEHEKLIINHIGSFYHARNSVNFVKALRTLLMRYPHFESKIKINFVGTVTSEDKNIIAETKLEHIINIVGRLSEEDCMKYYNDADVFLVFDGSKNDNLFYPSKLLKYFYYQKPILGLVNNGSLLESELIKARQIAIERDCEKGIVKYLYKAITCYSSLLNFDKMYYKQFLSDIVVKRYSDYLQTIL